MKASIFATLLLITLLLFGLTLPWLGTANEIESLLPQNLEAAGQFIGSGAGKMQIQDASSGPVWRVTTEKATDKPYRVALRFNTKKTLGRGQIAVLSFQARTLNTKSTSGASYIYCYFEPNFPPHVKSLKKTIPVGPEWTQVRIPFSAVMTHPAQRSRLGLGFGFLPQTVELRDIQLNLAPSARRAGDIETLPKIAYPGQESDASWRAAAQARITKYRQALLTITVLGPDGLPVPDARVRVSMQRHSFGFGSQVDAVAMVRTSADARKYQDLVARLYNKVVFQNDLKWGPWLKGEGQGLRSRYSRTAIWKALDWLEARRIPVRGHWMIHNVLEKLPLSSSVLRNPQRLRQALEEHVRDETSTLAGRLVEWDAINHLVGWGSTLTQQIVGLQTYTDLLRLMRHLDPQAKLYVNEGIILPGGDNDLLTRRDAYAQSISKLLRLGTPLDGIGFMAHFDASSLTSPDKLYSVLDRFASFGLDLQITEFDVDQVPEDLQADYLKDCMTLCFSHPKVVGFIMWGFWEKAHWRPQAALYRADWSEKPAGRAWRELVFGDWWTDVAGQTDRQGQFKVQGFLGEYQVDVEVKAGKASARIILPAGGLSHTIRLGSS
jgi:endo-1,4-beta-xylanase